MFRTKDQQWTLTERGILLDLEDIDLACVFQRLSPVAEPHSYNLSVIVQLSGNFCNLLAGRQCILLKVGVKNFYRLRREAGTPLAFFGRFTANKLHQILLAFLIPVLGFSQPLLQHWLQLLRTLGGDIQLFKSAVQKKNKKKRKETAHCIMLLCCCYLSLSPVNSHESDLQGLLDHEPHGQA